jgi:hypothetical protein
MDLEAAITENVRLALNGDSEACKKLNLLIQFPFSSIEKLFHTTEESKLALGLIAGVKATQKNPDMVAVRYCKKNMPDALPKKIKV